MMELFKIRRLYDTMIYLIACTINRHTPKSELINDSDIEAICRMAKKHTVAALVTTALERIGKAPADAVSEKNMAIRKIMLLDAERKAIFAEFEKNRIKYMPLKGVIMKEYYPSIGLRQMSDNDILFDPERRNEVRDIMLAQGYKVESFNSGNHDVYMKEPVYNYEMHASLFSSYSYEDFAGYFDNAFDVAVKDEKNSYGYSMSDDYYYIYVKTHEYKHHSYSGTGIRSLVDTFVFLRKKESALDFDYVKREIGKLGFAEYEEKTRILAKKIFDIDFCEANLAKYASGEYTDPLGQDERKMLDGFFFAGTYGTSEKNIENSLEKIKVETGTTASAKREYLFRKIFPRMDYYKEHFPFFYKYKILIPFLTVYRVCGMIFTRPKSTFTKLRSVISYKGKDTRG